MSNNPWHRVYHKILFRREDLSNECTRFQVDTASIGMASTQTPAGFSLETFLIQVVPGLVMISPILLNLWITTPVNTDTSSATLVVIALAALISGEIVEQLRSGLFRVPIPFSYHIYTVTEDMSHLPKRYRYAIRIDELTPDRLNIVSEADEEYVLEERFQFNFLENMEEEFSLDPDSALPRDFYDSLLLYLGDGVNTLTQDYQKACKFNQNLKISVLIALFFYGYYAVWEYPNPLMWVYLLAAMGLSVITFLITRFLMASSNLYVEMLFKEFYMKNRDN